MPNSKSPLLKISGLLVIVFFIGGLFLLKRPIPTAILAPANLTTSQSPSPIPQLPVQPLLSEVHSGDGTMTLIRKIETPPGQPLTYSFFVANLTQKDYHEQLVYSRTAEPAEDIQIPGNSWSPDNKHFYLQVKDAAGETNFLVFKASGEAFKNQEPYLNVGTFFKEKMPKSILTNATGWASPIFLNVTTQNQEAQKGPAYWFDIQSQNFWGHR